MFVKEDVIYSTLMEQISSALSNIRLYEEKETTKKELQNVLEALKISEEKYKEIATLLPTIIVETDTKLSLRYLNQAGYEAFGLDDKKPLAEQSILEFIHTGDQHRIQEYSHKALTGGSHELNEFRLVREDGSLFNLLGLANPIRKGETIEGLRWSALDIRPLISASISLDEEFFNEFKISPRETDVLKLWLQGYHIREIAKKLYIAESTVKIHIGSIYDRLNVKSKTEFFNFIKDYQIKMYGYESFLFSLVRNLIME
jgi:PAS domain S-box-containing protein